MAEANRSRKELIEELKSLRARVAELEKQQAGSPTGPGSRQKDYRFSSPPTRPTATVKMIHDKLQESEARYRMLVETMNEGLMVEDVRGVISYCNERICEMLRCRRSRLLGHPTIDFISPTDKSFYQQQTTVRSITTSARYELNVLAPDGREIPVSISARAIFNERGTYEGNFAIITDITQIKQAEEKIHLLTAIVEQSSDSIIYTDTAFRIKYLNQAAKNMFGWEIYELWGMTPDMFNADPRAQEIQAEIYATVSAGQEYFGEPLNRKKDGSTFQCQMKISPIYDISGNIDGYVGIQRDITEKKQAEEKIYRLHSAIEQSTEGIAVSDLEGNLQFINQAFAHMHGYEKQDLIGKNLSIFHSLEQRRAVNAANEQIHRTGSFTGEIWHTRRDGSTFPTYMNNSLLKDESGTPIGMIGTLHDITESKRINEVMNLLHAAVEQSTEGVALVNMEGNIEFLNYMFANLHGYEPQELIGKNFSLFHTLEQMPTVEAANETIRKTGVYDGEIWHTHRDGSTFLGHMHNTLLRDNKGNPTGILGTLTDITHLRQLEQELYLLREKIMQAERISQVSILSATMAHEINQPLSVIRLRTQDIHDQLSAISCPATILEDSQEVLVAVSRVVDIMQRYRSFSSRQRKHRMKNIDLAHIAQRVQQIFSENARRAKVGIHLELPEKACLLEGDVGEIEQIYFILIQNAIQAADGQKKHTLRIQSKVQSETFNLIFADDCGGVAPEIRDKIFEPFYTTKPPGEGTGLGLSILKRIVKEDGGTVTLDSRPGQGSTFIVTLPTIMSEYYI